MNNLKKLIKTFYLFQADSLRKRKGDDSLVSAIKTSYLNSALFFSINMTILHQYLSFNNLQYHHLYVIWNCRCFTLFSMPTISYWYRFSFVHNWSRPYLSPILSFFNVSIPSDICTRLIYTFCPYWQYCVDIIFK